MVTPRLLSLSILMLNGQMLKLFLQLWRMWRWKLNPSMGGGVVECTERPSNHPDSPTPSSSFCYLGMESNGTFLRPCMWKQRDSGVGTSRTLSPGTSRSDRIKKGSRSTDLHLLLWKKLLRFLVPSEASNFTGHCIGRSKAAYEFLLLHYFGVDSAAMHWDVLTSEILPAVQLPGASACQATAFAMFGASHITPSHSRMPRVSWTDSMTLTWSLLMGGRMGRFTGSSDTLVLDQRIDLRGFLAGSFAGLSTLRLLWKISNVVTNGKLGAISDRHSTDFSYPSSVAL